MDKDIKTPKVSVFMAAYNAEPFLKVAIESILNQTFCDFEFIIINDGSTDKTKEIIESYKDPRIIFTNHSVNQGLVHSRNFGIDNSRGEYLAIMDADDISLPDRIEKQVAFMDSHRDIDICGTWIHTFGASSGFTVKYYTQSDDIKASLLFDASLANPSVIIRKSTIDTHHLRYDMNHTYCEDYGLWYTASSVANFANIPEVLLHYRINEKSFTKTFPEGNFSVAKNLRKSLLEKIGLTPTEYEMTHHHALTANKKETTLEFLNTTEKWLLQITNKNKTSKIYNQKSLEKIISDRWQLICWHNTKAGILIFKKYIVSPLFAMGGLRKYSSSLKIAIKCYLKK